MILRGAGEKPAVTSKELRLRNLSRVGIYSSTFLSVERSKLLNTEKGTCGNPKGLTTNGRLLRKAHLETPSPNQVWQRITQATEEGKKKERREAPWGAVAEI
jgi:hypothetical protein